MNIAGLPDRIAAGIQILISGDKPKPGGISLEKGHYYADGSNNFWALLYDSGLASEALTWQDDEDLPRLGIGLTDLNKGYVPLSGGVCLETVRVSSLIMLQ